MWVFLIAFFPTEEYMLNNLTSQKKKNTYV